MTELEKVSLANSFTVGYAPGSNLLGLLFGRALDQSADRRVVQVGQVGSDLCVEKNSLLRLNQLVSELAEGSCLALIYALLQGPALSFMSTWSILVSPKTRSRAVPPKIR